MKSQSIGLQLRSLNNLIMRSIEKLPHKKQVESITGTNGWIIGYLSQNHSKDIYQKDLERHFCITRSTASKVLCLMERKGLIERRSVDRDARLKKIVLTPKAWEVSKWMMEDSVWLEKNMTKGFTQEELQNMVQYIQRMKKNIEEIKNVKKA